MEGNILFTFLPDLKAYRDSVGEDSVDIGSVNELLHFIERAYSSTAERLHSLLDRKEITYDLLWALFKPNAVIYTICPGTEQPMCVRLSAGIEKRPSNRPDHYALECRYFDYDGKIFGEASDTIEIVKFRGTKKINTLGAYPLQHHRDSAAMQLQMILCGHSFVSLMGRHHRQYQGLAFRRDPKLGIVKVSVKGPIMIDPRSLRDMNPNYRVPPVQVYEDPFFGMMRTEPKQEGAIEGESWNVKDLKPEDLLVCSPTVQGYSLVDKQWREFIMSCAKTTQYADDMQSNLQSRTSSPSRGMEALGIS